MSNKDSIADKIGQATKVVFSFDTTGSMRPCIAAVRAKIEETCEELFEDIPNLRIGMIAHGDYCDGERAISKLELTDNKEEIFNFIRNTPNTAGGDAPECYELALRTATYMDWKEDGGILVMIGDDQPHDPDYPQNEMNIDWRKEVQSLKDKGIAVYPMQCLYSDRRQGREAVNKFWDGLAELSDTALLRLNDMQESDEMFKGMAYAAAGEEAFAAYEGKLAASGKPVSADTAGRNAVLRSESAKYNK